LQETQKSLLFLLFAANGFASMTAERAQFEELATASAQPVNAFVAKYLSTMGALVGRSSMLMPWADQRTIRQHNWRGRAGDLEFGYGDRDVSALHKEINITQPQYLALGQLGFHYRLIIDVRSVRRAAVAYCHLAIPESDFAMFLVYRGVLDNEIVPWAAAESVHAQVQINHLVVKPGGFNQ